MTTGQLVYALSKDFDENYTYLNLTNELFILIEDGHEVATLIRPEIIEEYLKVKLLSSFNSNDLPHLKSDFEQTIDKIIPELYGDILNNLRCQK